MAGSGQFSRAVRLKCPRCGEGDLFEDGNPYNLGKLADMPKRCPSCDQVFEPEAGFYYGAMWISYAVGVFLSLILVGLLVLIRVPVLYAFLAVVAFHLLFSPYLFRLSRSVWLSFYVHQHRDV